MEMGNVSKRQQPREKAENSQRQPMSLQQSEKTHTQRQAPAGS